MNNRVYTKKKAPKEAVEVGQFLVVDPRVCHGQLTFKGTRLPVNTVLYWLGQGETVEEILADWPYLTRAAITEAVQLASRALIERYAPHDVASC
jgi:uncharacterized protein (DUF433 family)